MLHDTDADMDFKMETDKLSSRMVHPLEDVLLRLPKVGHDLNIDLSDIVASLDDKFRDVSVSADPDGDCSFQSGLVTTKEFECSLCFNLFVEPITIACGHTYCRHCLANALSISSKKCPQCRAPCHVDPLTQNENKLISTILRDHFGDLYAIRLSETNQVLSQMDRRLPVFYMNQLYFPFSKMRLHFFEPRYQTMIRRALEGNRTFGYIGKRDRNPIQRGEVGVVAHIIECEFFADGRSLVEVVFGKRFRVRSAWVEDGTFGLWYCNYEDLSDDVMTQATLTSLTTRTQHDALSRAVGNIRSRGAPASNFPCTEFDNEPPQPRWLTDDAWDGRGTELDICQMSEQLSAWTLWCCGMIRQEFGHQFTPAREDIVFTTCDTSQRLSTLVEIVNARRGGIVGFPNFGSFFASSSAPNDAERSSSSNNNQSSSNSPRQSHQQQNRPVSAVQRFRQFFRPRPEPMPVDDVDDDLSDESM